MVARTFRKVQDNGRVTVSITETIQTPAMPVQFHKNGYGSTFEEAKKDALKNLKDDPYYKQLTSK